METIGFADIAGSTTLYETLGDAAAKKLVIDIQSRIGAVIASNGCEVVEIVGDEVMFRSSDPNLAARCATAIHETMDWLSAQRNLPLAVRIGLHCGPVLVEQDRMFGDTINVAARMVGLANKQKTIVTADVVRRLSTKIRRYANYLDQVRVKGKDKPLAIYILRWEGDRGTTMMRPCPDMVESKACLRLSHAGRVMALSASQSLLSVGRDPANDLVVSGPGVSRHHATFEFVRGKFVLRDDSTNGTFVIAQDQQALFLRREELPLWGRGRIGLGVPASEDDPNVLNYELSVDW